MEIDIKRPEETKILDAIDRASIALYEEPPRPHFGLSLAGHHCSRWLWYSFHWAVIERDDNHVPSKKIKSRGQLLRLFQRGHLEESLVIELLERAGCVLAKPSDGDQFRIDFGSHVSGSLDGIITSGVPGAEKSAHILEIKTHGSKSFADLERHGVAKSKPMHFAQMQSYMHGTHAKDFAGPRLVKRALYVAVCKDDDQIYIERVRYDEDFAASTIERAKRVALAIGPPPMMSSALPNFYQCKMCKGHDLCHGSRVTREVNCRTCAHSTATEGGTWMCEHHGETIPLDSSRFAHDCHAMHPELVPWDVVTLDGNRPVFGTEDGEISDSLKLVKLRVMQ